MPKPDLLALLPVLLAFACTSAAPGDAGAVCAPGPLIVVGGGGTTPEIQRATLELCGADARVVVIPQASAVEDRGVASVAMWRAAGFAEVLLLDPLVPEAATTAIAQADLIWMPGGAQSRLVAALKEAGLDEAVRARHRAGAAVGGTSAGAAAMSEIMISGKPDPASLVAGAMPALEGLALWPAAIVDQHFTARGRESRLLTAVLDHPERIGVGIDERTAVVVTGSELAVIGEGHVIVFDARRSTVEAAKIGEAQGARNVTVHVLKPGMRFSWKD